MSHTPPSDLRQFSSLVEIMRILRSPGGCPWDQEQTHQSLARYAIEETFELVEAIEELPEDSKSQDLTNPMTHLIEELGDVLLQVVFHAELGRGAGQFTIQDVIENLNAKLVFRHPHVFKDAEAKTSEDVLKSWARLKEEEAALKKRKKSKSLFGIPKNLPSLEYANKIGEKTHKSGFDWHDVPGVLSKLREEFDELEEAYAEGTVAEHEHELGDVLFTLAQVARHLQVNADASLRKANRRFENRYTQMLKLIQMSGKELQHLSDDEKETYWQEAKRILKHQSENILGENQIADHHEPQSDVAKGSRT